MTTVKLKTAALRSELSDEEITMMMMAMNPEMTSLQIQRIFGETPILLVTKSGLEITGTPTAIREDAVELRQDDGYPIWVLKREVAAVRRPRKALDSEIIENKK